MEKQIQHKTQIDTIPSTPSELEVDLMIQLRKKVMDLNIPKIELEDKVLVRWLRARNNNLKDAEQMLRKHAEWKIEMDIANIYENGIPFGWDEELPWILSGFSTSGSPVCISDSSKWDFSGVLATYRKPEFIRYGVLTLEEKWRIMLLQGENQSYIPQLVSIYDLKGVSWRNVASAQAIDTCLTLARTAEANYPEIVQTLILVNVPRVFQLVWKLLSPLLSERTRRKILFLGWDKAQWTKEISKIVPLDQFPKYYGGTGDDSINMRLYYRGLIQQQKLLELVTDSNSN